MPELPDLQVFSSNLDRMLSKKKVTDIKLMPRGKSNVAGAKLRSAITNKKVKNVYREGKEIHFAFSSGDVLALHLMMHGAISRVDGNAPVPHAVLELHFTGFKIVITDWQRAANVKLNPDEPSAPDAMSPALSVAVLKEKLQKRTIIKKFLLDQKIIRGIGNAYADEILWDARISPFSVCEKLPVDSVKALHRSIKKVLKNAEKSIRKSDPHRLSGELRDFLDIHNAKKKLSPGKATIKHAMIGGRKTYYTKEQKLYK
jgi:formamidopyrimidine-DNA glycosylase